MRLDKGFFQPEDGAGALEDLGVSFLWTCRAIAGCPGTGAPGGFRPRAKRSFRATTWRGLDHFRAYVWSAIVAHNLGVLARNPLKLKPT